MVLLHYLVVPGLGDSNGSNRSRPDATAVRAAAPAEGGDTTAPAVVPEAAAPVAEVVCAA